jgi:CBS domain-containing protein
MTVVADIMVRDVVTIPPNAPIADLIQTLDERGITGVPVVDEREILVGVVSQRDVVRLAHQMEETPEARRWGLGVTGPTAESAYLDAAPEGEFFAYYVTPTGGFVDVRDRIRDLPPDAFEGYRVEDVMTSAPFTVESGTPLAQLARFLLDRKVHRALVVDAGKLVGIVTTSDILKAVAEG